MRKCPVCESEVTDPFLVVRSYEYLTCSRCRAVFLESIDRDEQISRHSSPEYKHARIRADSQRGLYYKWQADMMRRIKSSGSVLDVGSGAGYFVKTLCDVGYDAIGVDLGEENVRHARDNLRVTVLNGDFMKLTGVYDIITLHQLIEHVANPHDFLSKARSMLGGDGVMILSTPNLSFARKLAKLPRPILRDALGRPPNHCILYEPTTIRWILERHGFKVTTIRNNPTGLRTKSTIRRCADPVMNILRWIGPNMIIVAVPQT